ncbi:MAG: hypothetical protein HY429_02570 [Candidatus Levybacteria bacterium]|nr:hypothetical protein [Candidatus Levybacteria bacterium]
MPYQKISSDYFFSKWYRFLPPNIVTEKTDNEEYETLGTFSPNTNWEKVFALGDSINRGLQMTEQEVIDEVTNFRKRKNR